MPGIKCGDMGPKFGYHSKDNGWLTLDNVRIPKDHLFEKFIKVSPEGDVTLVGDKRSLYISMMQIRTLIVAGASTYLMQPLQIALRYSVVRRQFRNISGQKEETQLLDYQT